MYFSVTKDNRTNWEWQAHFIRDTHNKYILDALTNDEVLTLSEPITLFLINGQGDVSQRKAIPFAADLIYWSDDITYKSFKPSGPGSQVIISANLKSVLGTVYTSTTQLLSYPNENDRAQYTKQKILPASYSFNIHNQYQFQ